MKDKSYIHYYIDDCDDTALTIEDIFVTESDRRKGLGKKMVKEAIEYARDNNFEKVNLFACSTNGSISDENLVEFYRECGFYSHGDCDQLMEYSI